MIKFRLSYFLVNVVLLLTLIFIAVFVTDQFIRPFVGDVLVVIWLYFFIKCWLDIPSIGLSIIVLLFAYCIETAQYFGLVYRLNLQDIKIVHIIIGSTFDVSDLFAYTFGWAAILIVIWFETNRRKKRKALATELQD